MHCGHQCNAHASDAVYHMLQTRLSGPSRSTLCEAMSHRVAAARLPATGAESETQHMNTGLSCVVPRWDVEVIPEKFWGHDLVDSIAEVRTMDVFMGMHGAGFVNSFYLQPVSPVPPLCRHAISPPPPTVLR